MSNIRTRFAPSPTGYIHIGNVRAALTPFLIARHAKGSFILRIEDTDRARYVPEATAIIMDTLSWLGLSWDEGPISGTEKDGEWQQKGAFAPYFQTQRQDLYIEWAKKLIKKGRAYADPYTPEQVQKFRESDQAGKIPFLFRNHRPDNPPDWHPGLPLRFKTEPKNYSWHDEVFGDLSSTPEVLDDIILIKSDGLPTYNFAHIIDDQEMQCTYITRGMEYLSSMPNYMALYEALEIAPPQFVHLPHILAPGGKKKLGKRDGAKSVTEYRADGILPEAMVNFLALLGWNDGTEQEIFSMDDLIEKFTIDRIQKSPANFDETKLLWLNGQWIRRLPLDDLLQRAADFWPESAAKYDDTYKKQVLEIIYDRLKTLSDLTTFTTYFFADPTIDTQMLTSNKFLKDLPNPELINLLQACITDLSASQWDKASLQDTLNNLLAKTGQKPATLFSLIRIAISFAPFSPALNDTLSVLGNKTSLSRLTKTLEVLSTH